jgi:hypothetical protein
MGQRISDTSADSTARADATSAPDAAAARAAQSLVWSARRRLAHFPDCTFALKIAERNYEESHDLDVVSAECERPCRVCRPNIDPAAPEALSA